MTDKFTEKVLKNFWKQKKEEFFKLFAYLIGIFFLGFLIPTVIGGTYLSHKKRVLIELGYKVSILNAWWYGIFIAAIIFFVGALIYLICKLIRSIFVDWIEGNIKEAIKKAKKR